MCAGSLHSAPRRIQGDVGELRFDPGSPRLEEAVETFLCLDEGGQLLTGSDAAALLDFRRR